MRRSKAAISTALLFLLVAQCLALASATAAPRMRQGDYLDRMRRPRAAKPPPATDSSAERPAAGRKESDRVAALPGQPDGVGFAQYAGYVTVDAAAGRALFYYLAEAAGDGGAASKPLLLWLNGGPGCSSLGYGAMEELGPFRVMSDGETLYLNPYSWNHAANVLFLESPAGVGFSYSNTTADYSRSGDSRTAEDARLFLLSWMERFPEYKARDFYIAGESYAGHYVPQLAAAILRHAAAGKPSPISLKGIMIGNAVINDETDNKGMYDFYWTHALISDEAAGAISKNCDFANLDASSKPCFAAIDEAGRSLNAVDIYNIYAPMCQSAELVTPPITPSIESFDPCTDQYVEAYLNNADVQKALHVNVARLNYPWAACSFNVMMNWTDTPSTVLPIIQKILRKNIRVWVYSGDNDGKIPVTSSRYSVNQLQLPVADKWRPWFSNTEGAGEVGGYVVQYQGNLSLVTVRGAGHEVPSYQPQRALVLVQHFLEGKPLPNCKTCQPF